MRFQVATKRGMAKRFNGPAKGKSSLSAIRLAHPIPEIQPTAANRVEHPSKSLDAGSSKCACGARCSIGGENLEGRKSLSVSQPGDSHETEADRVAVQLMQMPDTGTRRPSGGWVQPLNRTRPARAGLGGGGRSLSSELKAFFEPRMGRDLSGIRIHTNAKAAETAKAVKARAFTMGQDIAFADGAFRPQTNEGRFVLAHELAHTAQSGPNAPDVQRYVDCKPVTLAGRICPRREPGEIRDSRTTAMVMSNVSLGLSGAPNLRGGWILANFAVGSSTVKKTDHQESDLGDDAE